MKDGKRRREIHASFHSRLQNWFQIFNQNFCCSLMGFYTGMCMRTYGFRCCVWQLQKSNIYIP